MPVTVGLETELGLALPAPSSLEGVASHSADDQPETTFRRLVPVYQRPCTAAHIESRACVFTSYLAAPFRLASMVPAKRSLGLPGGSGDVGGVPVQRHSGPLWWSQVSQLSECLAGEGFLRLISAA